MKLLIALTAILAGSTANQQWENFKLEHNKVYENVVEERTRFAIFQKNLQEIEQHNKQFDAGLVSWKQGITPFTDWTEEEFISHFSVKTDQKLPKYGTSYIRDPNIEAPNEIDWNAKGKVSPVKDQNKCVSGWAFATTGVIESQLMIQGKNITLSEQQMIDCSLGNLGCFGGWVETSLKYVEGRGLETESDYQYTGKDNSCKYESEKIAAKITGYNEVKGEDAIKDLVGTRGPAAIALDGAYNFRNYKSGIIDVDNCPKPMNHAMLIVGYGKEGEKDYWLLKNSWGTAWGEKGYMRLARGKNMCNIGGSAFIPVL